MYLGIVHFEVRNETKTEWNSAKKLGLTEQPHRVDVAQMVVHQLAIRQARVSSIPGSAPQGGFFLTELTSDEEMAIGLRIV